MFDSLAHPQLDTHRGEYPTFLKWRQSTPSPSSTCDTPIEIDTICCETDKNNSSTALDSPPPTPTLNQNQLATPAETSTARPHIVLGRGEAGGIWADMGHDHNQTLSYNEHMELPLYSFADFIRDNPEHDKNLDRPLRSTVSAYYKAHVQHTGIQSNFSNYTTVTGIYHLKDMEHHCCCGLDPRDVAKDKQTGSLSHFRRRHSQGPGPCQSCAAFRYVVIGHVDLPSVTLDSATTHQHSSKSGSGNRTRFMIRAKTVVLATGTFDQPKKLPAAKADPCALPASPTAMIQQTFHDTRQLEEWMKRHDRSHITTAGLTSVISPPPSPSPSPSPSKSLATADISPPATSTSTLPIVIVGTGLSAADAILLIHEKQPWRRVIHIYKHFSASEPSPLKRCHRDVYPEYNSIWMRMKRFATLKNSVQSYQHPKEGEQPCRVFGNVSQQQQSTCEPCKQLLAASEEQDQDCNNNNELAPLCATCSYKGLPDASVASWDPVTGQIVLVLSHGVVIREEVAAVGVFIGKQVHMGFLKGSLAQEMLSSSSTLSRLGDGSGVGLGLGAGAGVVEGGRISLSGRRKRSSSQAAKELAVDIPTPPCTPPRSPVLRPAGVLASSTTTTTTARQQFWHKQALESLHRCRGSSSSDGSSGVEVKEETNEEGVSQGEQQQGGSSDQEQQEEEEDDEEEEQADPSTVLTLLNPLVSDMYNFRLIPTGIVEPVVVHQDGGVPSSSLSILSSAGVSVGGTVAPMTLLASAPTFPTKAKKCIRLPCYPIRRSSTPSPPTADSEAAFPSPVSTPSSRVGKSIRAMSSACISMPCSPLLGSRIVCPTLPTPPLLSLCTAAANALTNSMSALTPRCSLVSGAGAAAGVGSLSSSSVTSSVLSSRRSSRCSRSSSISSLTLSATTSVDSGAVVVAVAAATVDDATEDFVVAAVGDDVDVDEPTKGGAVVSVDKATVVVSGDSEMKEGEEEERHNYSLSEQDEVNEDVEMVDGEKIGSDEEEDVTPYPPPATPTEKLLEPRMDHSIYAAGAITGSKFVRYVLGNGCAIVADILRSEGV
ncbi:Oxidative stress-induced growth inhibitor 2 [Mortierella sp. 14UC]|nr:Oxidative stress-induced growth inhibitor 2 [Mortierella sp. 14UC]